MTKLFICEEKMLNLSKYQMRVNNTRIKHINIEKE